jgi:UV DNA damage repair endonuclease
MVKHIVLFKLSSSLLPENKHAKLKKMEEIFSPLGKELPYIIEYRTGYNFSNAAHAWDFAIDSVFRSKEDLQRYQESAEHQEAIKKGMEIKKTKAVIDYEF